MPKMTRAKLEKLVKQVHFFMLGHGGFVREAEIGIVLGSGLGNYAESALTDSFSIPYDAFYHFPKPTIDGHAGNMWFGKIGERNAVIMQGRVHGYEGYRPDEIVFPVRLMIALGAKKIVLTNAVGAIKRDLAKGDLVVIKDHIGFFYPFNPLFGSNDNTLGPRFPGMNNAYDKSLRAHALDCLKQLGHRPLTGIYAAVAGPQYETPAEIQILKGLGVDMVGMSVVPETIAAVHMGAQVLAVSCVTNMAAGICDNSRAFQHEAPELSHAEVIEESAKNEEKFAKFMTLAISTLPKS